MGSVFLVEDIILNQELALKIIKKTKDSQVEFLRFQKEVISARSVSSKHVIKAYDYGITEDFFYFSMEYVKGPSLKDFLSKNCIHLSTKIDYFAQICQGLADIHDAGIIHRDIKLSNVLIDTELHTCKISDLGICQFSRVTSSSSDPIGSASHLAPEIWKGEEASHASDIYALGVLAWELFAEELPFKAQNLTDLIQQHLKLLPPDISKLVPDLPAPLANLIARMLHKNPANRPHIKESLWLANSVDLKPLEIKEEKPARQISHVFANNSYIDSKIALPKSNLFTLSNFALTCLAASALALMFSLTSNYLPGFDMLASNLDLPTWTKLYTLICITAFLLITAGIITSFSVKPTILVFFILLIGASPSIFQIITSQIFSVDPTSMVIATKQLSRYYLTEFLERFSFFNSKNIPTMSLAFGVVILFNLWARGLFKLSQGIILAIFSLLVIGLNNSVYLQNLPTDLLAVPFMIALIILSKLSFQALRK